MDRPSPLLATTDPHLVAEVQRLAASVGVSPMVVGDAGALLRRWHGPPLVLVGADLVEVAATVRPPRRSGVVLVSTGTGWMMVPASPKVLGRMIGPRRYRDPEYAKSIAAEIYGGILRERPELARDLLDSHSPVGSRRGYLLQLMAASGWTSLPFLRLIRQPTLIVAGTDDHAYGQSAAASLAISNPAQAVDNADSHEYFGENTPALQ